MKKRFSILLVLLCLFACIFSINPVIAEEGEETETTSEVLELEETDPEEETTLPEEEEVVLDETDEGEVLPPVEEEPGDEPEAPETGEQEVVFEGVTFVVPEGFKVRQSDIQGKKTLKEEAYKEAPELVEGEDCVEKELFFLTDDEEYARQVAEIYHAELTSFNNDVAVITITDDLSVEKAFAASLEEEALPFVEPNYIVRLEPSIVADQEEGRKTQGETITTGIGYEEWINYVFDNPDPFLTTPGYYNYFGIEFQWQHEAINTYAGWNTTMGGGVTVAVIDEGINVNHEEFTGKYFGGVNLINILGTSGTATYGEGHGNHVAGIIGAAVDNGVGGAGIAPYVNILGINVFKNGEADTATICAAINAAAADSNHVDIINMSLGGYWYSENENQAIQNAYKKGIVIVAAAGNDGSDIKEFPAAYDHVIAVAATNKSGTRAFFSNYGSWVTIAAPGVRILSSCSSEEDSGNDIYNEMSGTSQATPVVSGALALYMSKVGHINYEEAIKVLKASAEKAASPNIGYGIISVEKMFKKVSTLPEFHVYKSNGIEYTKEELAKPVEPGSYVVIYNPSEGSWEWTIYSTNGKKPSVKNNEVINGEVAYNGENNIIDLDNFEKGKTITINAAIVNAMGVVGKNATLKVKTPSVQVQAVKIKELALSPAKPQLYYYDEKTTEEGETSLYVSVTKLINTNGETKTLEDVDHIWTTSNDKVCQIIYEDNGGAVIKATGSGTAKVTLKMLDGSGKSATVNVTSNQLATEVKITGQDVLVPGGNTTYKATVLPKNAKNKKVSWYIDDVYFPSSFDASGITMADINIGVSNGKLTVSNKVPVGTEIDIVAVSEDLDLLLPNAYTYKTVTICEKASSVLIDANEDWKDLYDDYYYDRLTYDKKGKLTGVTLFTTEIEDDYNYYLDRYIKLDGTVVGNDIAPVWTTSNEKVAIVYEDGYVVAVGPGTAKITCTANDGSKKKATVTVKVVVPASGLTFDMEEEHDLAIGKTLDLSKCVSIGKQYGKPTVNKLNWEIEYASYNGNDITAQYTTGKTKYITVSSAGKLKVDSKIKKALNSNWGTYDYLFVVVAATTTDGTKYTDYKEVYVQNAVTKIAFEKKSYKSTDDDLDFITVDGNQVYVLTMYANAYIMEFDVKSSNPSIGSAIVDSPRWNSAKQMYSYDVYFINNSNKKGTVTLTVKALDGSNKSAKTKFTFK